jgi:porphobilinogen synthase
MYPTIRPRRLRRTAALRAMVRETELSPGDFIYPLFVVEGEGIRRPIGSMPGVFNLSVDELVREAESVHQLGIPSVILFGVPNHKDPQGSQAYAEDGIVQRALRAVKKACPELVLLADVCLCEYTSHGHCGLLDAHGEVQNDPSLPLLSRMALTCAQSGADVIAPSDMMDGRVAAIRSELDRSGFSHLPILSYAAKYASAFYGPFREAAQSTPQSGDRKGYQMDPGNVREALREVEQDLAEGADLVMVKPALAYLDVIRAVKERTQVPVAAYNVSGEYAMVKAAAQNGWIDHDRAMMECLTSIKRAGADLILTYFAKDAAKLLG